MKGLQVAEQIRHEGAAPPIIILTVPQNPVQVDPAKGVDRVLSMPFSGFDLVNILTGTVAAAHAASSVGQCRVYTLYAPKGGVGKTTLAFNLAVAMTQQGGLRTALVDGSFQFGDLRSLLKVPQDAPSLLDLPTDRIQESDLSEVMWRDPSGIDILLAPPRVEMAEMITPRDLDKVLSLLRARLQRRRHRHAGDPRRRRPVAARRGRRHPPGRHRGTRPTLHNTRAMGDTFRAIGYPPGKLRYLLNRADANGGLTQAALVEQLGRPPEYAVVSDGRLVVECNNQGLPFVLAEPGAAISRDLSALAGALQPGREPVGAAR